MRTPAISRASSPFEDGVPPGPIAIFKPSSFFFFFNVPAPPEISPLPLPDALPILAGHLRVSPRDRPSPLDLLREDRHDASRTPKNVPEPNRREPRWPLAVQYLHELLSQPLGQIGRAHV